MTITLSNFAMHLPTKLEEAFRLLVRGRHVSSQDGEVYASLQNETDAYRRIFAGLGYELIGDTAGFYYFNGARAGLNRTVSEFALFTFIMVDWLADNDQSIEEGLFASPYLLDELPHLQSDRYRGYMRQAGGDNAENMRRILQAMDRAGFVRFADDKVRFLIPIRRILGVCLKLGKRLSPGEPARVAPIEDEEGDIA